ncbi:programmed cell death 1 ligand 1 isoform X2 [Polypterus senegalus]|uniref:programmed cell death 1 ligand 1 isoform X2 n=1 Tax=Polypterus senegalus TaxID=55291 RepID=UPI0019646E7C|nr:programmed cell death 1 ligand 1 isoform X2 [Polypterus senegalus]
MWASGVHAGPVRVGAAPGEHVEKIMKIFQLLVLISQWPALPALFTVEMLKPLYTVEFKDTVRIECRFSINDNFQQDHLSVFWHQLLPNNTDLEVFRMFRGTESLKSQHSRYKGRASLMTEPLKDGLAMLQISDVQIEDSGRYRCLIDLNGDPDYKETTLSVKASYNNSAAKFFVQRRPENKSEVELICQSQGYPPVKVLWRDSKGRNLTSHAMSNGSFGTNHLFQVSSRLNVPASTLETFSCTFWNESLKNPFTAFLTIPDVIQTSGAMETSHLPPLAALFSVLIVTVVTMVVVGVILWKKKHPCQAHIRKSHRRMSELHIPINSVQDPIQNTEDLQELLKERYMNHGPEECMTWSEEVPLFGQLASSGQPQRLQEVLQETDRLHILEEAFQEDQSSLCRALARTWADSNASDPYGVKKYSLILLLQLTDSVWDFFGELVKQLIHRDKISTEELQMMLMGAGSILLILDHKGVNSTVSEESLRTILHKYQNLEILLTKHPEGQQIS